jgi:hypothetical protein
LSWGGGCVLYRPDCWFDLVLFGFGNLKPPSLLRWVQRSASGLRETVASWCLAGAVSGWLVAAVSGCLADELDGVGTVDGVVVLPIAFVGLKCDIIY